MLYVLLLERWLLAPDVLLLDAPLWAGGEGERWAASARASARLGESCVYPVGSQWGSMLISRTDASRVATTSFGV